MARAVLCPRSPAGCDGAQPFGLRGSKDTIEDFAMGERTKEGDVFRGVEQGQEAHGGG